MCVVLMFVSLSPCYLHSNQMQKKSLSVTGPQDGSNKQQCFQLVLTSTSEKKSEL
jgi:hypothetical protein